jgi:transcriptional regulator with XRE-family HTH domain
LSHLKSQARKSGGSAARLAELLDDLPIDRVASASGVSRSTLRRVLHGQKRGPSWETMRAVEEACQKLRK